MNVTPKTEINSVTVLRKNLRVGLIILCIDICISVAAQLVLKTAMMQIGAFSANGNWLAYFLQMIHPLVILGLGLFALATVLWIICLTKLDLSFAYPIAMVQYFLIFVGAWYFFGEQISITQFIGLLIITLGVIIISSDKKLA